MERVATLARSLSTTNDLAKRLIAEAAALGRFDEVSALARIAERLQELLGGSPSEPLQPGTAAACMSAPTPANERDQTTVNEAGSARFPFFVREGNDLVKIGWSRKENREYEHRAPRTLVLALVRQVTVLGKTGHRFTADAVMKNGENGDRVWPAYQSYAVLAWLRWAGLVVAHGRKGYSLPKPTSFAELADASWAQLTLR